MRVQNRIVSNGKEQKGMNCSGMMGRVEIEPYRRAWNTVPNSPEIHKGDTRKRVGVPWVNACPN
jgi:hypothetical protein